VSGEFVSGSYFSTFGLQPAAGRFLTDSDDVAGAPDTAVMSYETWKNDYNRDFAVVGSTFWVNTKPVTVVGVAPLGFYGDRLASTPPNFYLPIHSMPLLLGASYVNDPNSAWLYIVGRLRPGVPWAPLQEKIGLQLKQLLANSKFFSTAHGRLLLSKVHVVLTPGGGGIQDLQEAYFDRLRLLMWIAALVLLIACANIANLLLVRGMGRKAEMSVRTALGAARTRIVRQLLTESVMLAVLSGILALVVSYVGARMLLALAFSGEQHVPIHASPSWDVLAFALGVSIATGVLFGALALMLATVGLYGVTSYTVAQRTSEIGIRMALGAERGGVIAMIMRGAMIQALVGLGIGMPVALLCVRFVKSQLYEITYVDANVMLGAIVTLAIAASIAAIVPALRAASINPVQALRME
jgi:ABC-type antimicrobial peptide transport system permease subunit